MPFVPDQPQAGRFVPDKEPSRPGFMRQLGTDVKHTLGRAARMGAETVGAMPLMAADFGLAVRELGENVAAGRPTFQKTREYPSEMYRRGLDQLGLPRPQGAVEKVTDVVGQMAFGSRLPVPGINNPAPANFVSPARSALQTANRAGYVVPPATARPDSMMAGAAEGAAGKLTTGQRAAAMNQAVTNRLAAKAVGIADDGTVTREGLEAIRSQAGAAHEALRNFGDDIVSDTQYRVAISDAVNSIKSAAAKFPSLVRDKIVTVSDEMAQPRFSADEAVGAIKLLRGEADEAYRAGNGELGRAYRSLSNAFEGLIERNLGRSGKGGELLTDFRNARELIAKTYSIQNAMRGENVDAQALARALDRGKYLSGNLRTIAQFAQRFPKAARVAPSTESLPAYSPLDYIAIASSLAGGQVLNHPAAYLPAAYAASRPAIRSFLLSPAGQNLAVKGISPNALSRTAGASVPLVNQLGVANGSREQRR